MSGQTLFIFESVITFGLVMGFGAWQLYSLRKLRQERERREREELDASRHPER